jgi:hypothetical protein
VLSLAIAFNTTVVGAPERNAMPQPHRAEIDRPDHSAGIRTRSGLASSLDFFGGTAKRSILLRLQPALNRGQRLLASRAGMLLRQGLQPSLHRDRQTYSQKCIDPGKLALRLSPATCGALGRSVASQFATAVELAEQADATTRKSHAVN